MEVYTSIRLEIISNHVLMHWFSLIVLLSLLIGVVYTENRDSIISVFLPLLALVWAAAMVRFDFFIHRQIAYLRAVEPQLRAERGMVPLWETWKESLESTKFVVPIADAIIFILVFIITYYLLFGPAKRYFKYRGWSNHFIFSVFVLLALTTLLASLSLIPKLARM